MKICGKCNGCGKVSATEEQIKKFHIGNSLDTLPYLPKGVRVFKYFKVACPVCDGTGEILAKGEMGYSEANDFGQNGEDITNL